eukprot:Clim_evm25s206 gene=Clim_evmTU25s206
MATTPDYPADRDALRTFFDTFQKGRNRSKPYKEALQRVVNREQTVIDVHLDDIAQTGNDDLVKNIMGNTLRYHKLMSEAIDSLLKQMEPTVELDVSKMNTLDVFLQHRQNLRNTSDEMQNYGHADASYAPELMRNYELRIVPQSATLKQLCIREVRAQYVGKLITFKGIVTRVSEVKPMVLIATYMCDSCDYETYQEVTGPSFTPQTVCQVKQCKADGKGKLTMMIRGSKFVKHQELRIQELAENVPQGHVPRTITVRAFGEMTRQANSGDTVSVDGVLLVQRHTGYRAMVQGLLANTYVVAEHIEREKKTYKGGESAYVTEEEEQSMRDEAARVHMYDTLSQSIAPEVWGHEDLKKALLLALVGGTQRDMEDGMRIRGDINICMMGDPGVAKSQLLKHVANIAPRAVYTTGRGSSGVGLTAAVTRDAITGELVLEGGALILADKGVCCIDEFDKMLDHDRTAIHEVMEQQTISIAKAGITTTLNARTSILAAANPIYGRYNTKLSAERNINLPAALLSRFDLIFLLLDRADEDNDEQLANHICTVHQTGKAPTGNAETGEDLYEPQYLRKYIALAKSYNPTVPPQLASDITAAYIITRKNSQLYTNARTLLAILRLATAHARLRLADEVNSEDIEEAFRLMETSKISLNNDRGGHERQVQSLVWRYCLQLAGDLSDADSHINYQDLLRGLEGQGITESEMLETLQYYEQMDLISYDPDTSEVIVHQVGQAQAA